MTSDKLRNLSSNTDRLEIALRDAKPSTGKSPKEILEPLTAKQPVSADAVKISLNQNQNEVLSKLSNYSRGSGKISTEPKQSEPIEDRSAKIARLRAAVENGTYNPDSSAVAEKFAEAVL